MCFSSLASPGGGCPIAEFKFYRERGPVSITLAGRARTGAGLPRLLRHCCWLLHPLAVRRVTPHCEHAHHSPRKSAKVCIGNGLHSRQPVVCTLAEKTRDSMDAMTALGIAITLVTAATLVVEFLRHRHFPLPT